LEAFLKPRLEAVSNNDELSEKSIENIFEEVRKKEKREKRGQTPGKKKKERKKKKGSDPNTAILKCKSSDLI